MKDKPTGRNYLTLTLSAFAGIGLEVPLALWLEPLIYGAPMNEWSTLQNIIHWTLTCLLWGAVFYLLTITARKRYGFNIFQPKNPPHTWQWLIAVLCIIGSLIISYLDWNGFKVIKEFHSNGWLKFIFQYIYYIFETALVTLILIFGQTAFEKWFHKTNIPYGGIIAAITWGLGHILTKGTIASGILSAFSGLAFGSIYLLMNRDIRRTYPIILIMFVF